MRTVVVAASTHRPEEYAVAFAGHRAVQLLDKDDRMRAEIIWRLATGNTVEITEFGIFDPVDRRKGHGTRLLRAGLVDIQEFFARHSLRLRRIYLFCDAINQPGRAFWEARGFKLACILPDFYHYCDAVMYVRNTEDNPETRQRRSR
jgi:RimJ/RimL family protein N-acetyltransferase